MSKSTEEYKYFCEKYEFKEINYRKIPDKILPASKFAISSLFSDDQNSEKKDECLFIHEPITTLQKHIAEPLEAFVFLNTFAAESPVMDRLIFFTSFMVSSLSNLTRGRILHSVPSYLGETFEYIDSDNKILCIGEKVSTSPDIEVGHCLSDVIELKMYVQREYTSENNVIKGISHDRFTMICKDDLSKYTSDRPTILVHLEDKSDIWKEYIGTQIIKHSTSKARVELNFKGCYKYSEEDCIEGKVYDMNDELFGTLRGSYLTKLFFTKSNSTEEDEIADFKESKEIFKNHFSLSTFTLRLNDPVYDVKCPTDSRMRGDIQLLEDGDIKGALAIQEKIKTDSLNAEKQRKLDGVIYHPKWFSRVENPDTGESDYEYNCNYWYTKLDSK